MKHPNILLMALGLFVFSILSGQAGFQSAYIVELDGDTVRGLVYNSGEVQNSNTCLFRIDEQSEPAEYLPGTIRGFGFTGSRYFVSKDIELGGSVQTVFLECLVKGLASLYYFRYEDTELYFIEKEGSALVPLTNETKEVMINGNKTLVRSNNYIRMLKATFSDCLEIQPSIENVKLNHRSLTSITCRYNGYFNGGETCTIYKQPSSFKLRISPVIGYASNNLNLKGQMPIDYIEFGNSNGPVLGLVVDLSFRRLGDQLSFQVGTDFGKSSFNDSFERTNPIYPSTVYYYDVDMQGISMKIYAGAKYDFGQSRVRPNVGGGLMFHKYLQPDLLYRLETHYGEDVTTEEWTLDIAGNWLFGAYIQAGVDVDLSEKLLLFANIKGGIGFTNPVTIPNLQVGDDFDQIRVSYVLIPISVNLGFLF